MTRFYSTNHRSPEVSFKEALIIGQAPDRGLYMPKTIPKIPKDIIQSFKNKAYWQIAKEVASYIIEDEVPPSVLENIVKDAYTYEVPVKEIEKNKWVMYLDKGPTFSFKDFAARMMARLISYFLKQDQKKLTILTATSGDTGGAVADAFYGLDNIDVIVLFPKAEISERQRRQMTTLGKNVTAISVEGKFDHCQALVKEAFADPDLKFINLSSANSINFGRLLPQSVYYFYAYSRIIKEADGTIGFCVPSGNFGDLLGGVLAKNMGLPVDTFIAAVNENDEFPRFLNTGTYKKIEPSKACLSSAMNVGHPSNLARLIDLYGGHLDEKGTLLKEPDMQKLRKDIWSTSISDSKTRETIQNAYKKSQTIFEPHGAVGWAALNEYLAQNPMKYPWCVLETADPAKFPELIIEILGIDPPLPKRMQEQLTKPENSEHIKADYKEFKSLLIKKYA
jgi:threonine synthase